MSPPTCLSLLAGLALPACASNASSVSVLGSSPVASGTSTGAGTVVSDPPGVDCTITSGATTGSCSASFADHTVVTLTASAASSSTFGGWLNLASGTDFDYEQSLGFQNQVFLKRNPLPLDEDVDRTLVVLASFTTP